MHAYRERTCIVQISVGGRNAVLDALALGDLSPLRTALDRADVTVVMHGGDYDIACLTRDHDFRFHRVFDTMIAATLLEVERVGLASLVEDHFGVRLDKKYQRADWARRPLSAGHLDYLRRDTIYLAPLKAHLLARLEAADLVEEAEIEFARLAKRRGRPAEADPEQWRRIRGASELDSLGRCVLHALHIWREQEAERRDLPPFKVLAPHTLLRLAADPPRRSPDPQQLRFLSPQEQSRYASRVAAAAERGIDDHEAGRIPPARVASLLGAQEARRLEAIKRRDRALRVWRRLEITARKVPGAVVLPNPAIAWLAERVPTTLAELAECPDIGPKRIERNGKAILGVLLR